MTDDTKQPDAAGDFEPTDDAAPTEPPPEQDSAASSETPPAAPAAAEAQTPAETPAQAPAVPPTPVEPAPAQATAAPVPADTPPAGGGDVPPPPPPSDDDGDGNSRAIMVVGAVVIFAVLLALIWWAFNRDSGTEPAPVEPESPSGEVNPELVGPIWKLLEFQEPSGTTVVEDPNSYTLELKADGTAAAQADCNPGMGSYTVSGLEISLTIAFSRAACGPDSHSAKFGQSLNDAVSYMLGGELLNIGYGQSGAVMRFTKGTVIPAAPPATDAPPTVMPTEEPSEPPTAVITAPSSAKVGELVPFDASSSSGANPIVAYLWDFGDDTNANAVRIEHAYSRAGTFIVTLTVVDDQKVSGSTTAQIVVEDAEDVPPTAVITGPDTADVGEEVTFDGNSSEAGSSPIVRYDWDLGGVSSGEAGNQSTVTTAYRTPGSYHVSLTVTDANGLSGSASLEIAVNAPLEGIEWVLDGTLPGTEITLLLEDGQASGSAGCNTYTAEYVVNDNLIGFRDPTATQQACPEQIMVQEQAYLAALVTAMSYEISGESLTLATSSQPLTFTSRAR